MFGYINVNREELSKEEKQIYQSYYCGLCRRLKEACGFKGQMLLNYDMTFLVLLWSSLYEMNTYSEKFTCNIHPLKKKTGFINEATKLACDLDIVLSYHSLMDDHADNNSFAKLALAKSIESEYERIRMSIPQKVYAVEEFIQKTNEAEARKEKNIDLVAGYTGQMMSKIFVLKDDEWKSDLEDMGFYMGKFIYMMDAYEDLEKDIRRGNYNPLIYKKKGCSMAFETYCHSTLTSFIAECAKSFERLPIVDNVEIMRNILYSGVWTRYDYLRIKADKKEKEQKRILEKKAKRQDVKDEKLIRSLENKEKRLAKKREKIEKRKILRRKE